MCPMIARAGACLGAGVAWGVLFSVSCCHVIGVPFFSRSASLWCGVVPCLSYDLAYGGGIACPVFVADTDWAFVGYSEPQD